MDVITTSELQELVSAEGKWCVSIYMPTHPAGQEGQQDAIRLRNLVTRAEEQLIAHGLRTQQAGEILQPILDLPDDPASWRQRKHGLAVFRTDTSFATYWLATPLDESVVVDMRFHIKRLLPAINANPQFYVLAVSRNRVRLLKATWHGTELLHPTGLPTNIEEALNLQGADRGEQVHSGMRGDLGKAAGVFHGQGGHRDTCKEELVEYFRAIDRSLGPVLRESSWPLVLAGVEYELAIFREVSSCRRIAAESLYGSFDYVEDQSLCMHALPIAQKLSDRVRRNAIAKYCSLADTNLTSNEVEKIIPAAYRGQVDTLLVDYRGEEFGRYSPERNWIEFVSAPDAALDLVELSIAQTLRHQGAVYAATAGELCGPGPLRAIFRYEPVP
jgi:hypothetical protein